jgi:transposase, IS30 family
MTGRFQQLTAEERVALAALKLQGLSLRQIAQQLGRHPSTMSRELRRNASDAGYVSAHAVRVHLARRRAARPPRRMDPDGPLWPVVTHMLGWYWSPQQIARTLRAFWPDEPSMHVSHETIYNAIYAHPKGELRKALISCLRQGRSTRRPRSGGEDRRGQIPDMVSIHLRPPEVNDRTLPGHWEGDLIKGAMNRSSVGVLVERTTRLVLLARMPDATAESALAAFTAKLNQIAQPMRQSLTYDQGREMSKHQDLARNTNIRVYFCDPHSPWQKGSCENTNGLLRQFLPKGTDLSVHDQQALDSIADLLNNRPRQTLNWRSPVQAFAELMRNIELQAQATLH